MPKRMKLPGGTIIEFARKLTKAEKKRVKRERQVEKLARAGKLKGLHWGAQ